MPNSVVRSPGRRRSGALGRLLAHWPAAQNGRSAASLLAHAGISGFELPHSTDWAWRPNPWAVSVAEEPLEVGPPGMRLAADTTLFHDGGTIAAQIIQEPSGTLPGDAAPFGVELDVGSFDGSFLSFVLEVPPDGIAGLTRRHLFGASFDLRRDGPVQVYVRYNLRHGPNTETLLRELPPQGADAGRMTVEFDLAYVDMNERRVEAAWLDVILQSPAETRTTIRDLVVYRRPRAEL